MAQKRGLPGWWKGVVLLAVVVAIIVLSNVFHLGAKLEAMQGWIDGFGPWAPAVYVAIYIGATVLALPGSALTVPAGVLFGPVMGVVYVSLASTTGAAFCFLIARYLARGSISRGLQGNEKFQRLDRLTERQGVMIVAITRLVPVFPFNLLNYGFGLTRVPFWTYVLVSWACMLPGTVLYVVGPATVVEGVKKGEIPWVLIGIVALVIAVLTVLVRHARRKLREAEESLAEDAEGDAE